LPCNQIASNSREKAKRKTHHLTTHAQISFASNYFYDVGMGFPKLSMLAFYYTYFTPSSSRSIRNVILACTAFVTICYLTILFDDTFFCGIPVSTQWSQAEDACSVFWAPEPFILNFTLNLACYLVVYAVPVVLLVKHVLRGSMGVGITFLLGGMTIVASVVRFVTLKVGTGQENLVCKFGGFEKRRQGGMRADFSC
jgi:hypothetical protein